MEQTIIPTRIHRRMVGGWKMPPNTVTVTRTAHGPGKWGNPYKKETTSDRGNVPDDETAVRYFRELMENDPERQRLAITELKGKNLACWCPLSAKHCHADVLLEYANKE